MIGCTDVTHIPITASSDSEGCNVHRKSVHSINVLGWGKPNPKPAPCQRLHHNTANILCTVKFICEAVHIISNVEDKGPGSVNDLRIYNESDLSDTLEHRKWPNTLCHITHQSP